MQIRSGRARGWEILEDDGEPAAEPGIRESPIPGGGAPPRLESFTTLPSWLGGAGPAGRTGRRLRTSETSLHRNSTLLFDQILRVDQRPGSRVLLLDRVRILTGMTTSHGSAIPEQWQGAMGSMCCRRVDASWSCLQHRPDRAHA